MSYLIFGLALLALFHFVYESILAPSLRMKLHFELCALRDELRRLNWTRGRELTRENYDYLDEALLCLDSMLHRFDVGTLSAVSQELTRDPDLKREVEQRGRTLDGCAIVEAIEIRERLLRIASRALLINHGAWYIYVLPALFGWFGCGSARTLIRSAVSVPRSDLFRIAPTTAERTA
jgi:hypothetical protein